jgi:hypothetical protein
MNQTYALAYIWTLNQIISTVNKSNIDLTQNPTSCLSELIIQANTLMYGLYEFNLEVNLVTSDKSASASSSSYIKTYIQIIPTGIVVNAIENGISSILIGSQQNLTLNPSKYSFDLDNLILPSQILQFKFYCTTVLISSSFNQSLIQSQEDLLKIKTSGISSSLSRNRTCFDSISKN